MSVAAPPQPQLSRALLESSSWPASEAVRRPTAAQLALPERAVQFGTGAFLRGFIDYFIDAANAGGTFNGRIVAIGSTGSGRDRALADQDGLFTLVARDLVHGKARDERRVISSVSRGLSAATEWDAVLACARSPELRVVFSNTTEVGIALDDADAAEASPPRSFPAKFTRFLYERAASVNFDAAHGVVVVPCELIEANGDTLKRLVLTLADRWSLDPRFAAWIEAGVPFVNTLVDRIVPGAPSGADAIDLAATLGYRDELLTTSEQFRQFVIQGDEALAARLGFTDANPGIVVVPDIEPYRLRKVGLLNGAHTIAVTTALLCGCETVRDAMAHPRVGQFIRHTLLDDMVPTFAVPEAAEFGRAVLERFANPFIRHALIDITLHGTTKFRVRLVPTLQRAAQRWGQVPESLAFGMAAHLAYLRGDLQAARRAAGLSVPPDVMGERIHDAWQRLQPTTDLAAVTALVSHVLADEAIWGTDLTLLSGVVPSVAHHLLRILACGADAALGELQSMEAA